MLGFDYSLIKSATTNQLVYLSQNPENFTEALAEFTKYCERHLPKVGETVFVPTSFDITRTDDVMVLGGIQGTLASFDIETCRILRDEIICIECAIENVNFVLDDSAVVITNAAFELFMLDFPTFDILHKINLIRGPIKIKSCVRTNKIYISNQEPEIKVIQLFKDDDYFNKEDEILAISQESYVNCIEISDDCSLLVIGLLNGVISFISTETDTKLSTSILAGASPLLMCLSSNDRYLAVAFENYSIKVWNMTDLTFQCMFTNHTDLITGLAFIKDNKYLVSGSLDSLIYVWTMDVESLPLLMSVVDSKVTQLKCSIRHNAIYYTQEIPNIMIWKLPQLPQNARYREQNSKVISLILIPDTFDLVSIGENGKIDIWDYRSHSLIESKSIEGPLISAALTKSGTIVIASSIPSLYIWNYAMNSFDLNELGFIPVGIQLSSNENLIAISDSIFRVVIYDYDILTLRAYLKGHINIVTCSLFILQDSFLLTSSKDGTLGKWDLSSGERVGVMLGHESAVTGFILSENGYIISSSEDGMIIFWNLDCALLYALVHPDREPIRSIFLSSDHEYIITLQPSKLSFWQVENLSLMFQEDTLLEGLSLVVSNDQRFIAVAEGSTVFVEENPIGCKSLRIVGKRIGSTYKFMKFVIDCQKETSRVAYDMNHNHWAIFPYQFGPSHILAFYNRFDDLNKALFHPSNRAGFFSSLRSENPLSICVEKEYKICIDICLRYMKLDSQEREGKPRNPKCYVPLESCLTKLNSLDYPDIVKLYDTMFIEIHDAYLPRFCMIEANLPKMFLSEHFTIYPEELVDHEHYSTTGRPIVFSQSTFPLDIDLGTFSSINFLISLLDCSNQEIFRSLIVKEYLQCKWRKVKPAVYFLGSTYILYLVVLGLHITVFLNSHPFLLLLIFIHLMLVSYEILQIATDFGDYWGGWNVIDQLRSISFSYYALMAWGRNYNTDILLAVLIFSWTRGISCFRMFDETRYMVRLIIQVIIDITTFFFLLFYATLAFAFVFYMRNPTAHPFPHYLTVAYRLDLGDLDSNITEPFDWVIFFVATMINPLIMLNLLIAIMSDTAEAVAQIDDICGLRELTQMIVDVEKVMFWKKHLNHKHYLHKCDFVKTNEEEYDKVHEKLKNIKKQVVGIGKSIKKIKEVATVLTRSQIEDNINKVVMEQGKIREIVVKYVERSEELIAKIDKHAVV